MLFRCCSWESSGNEVYVHSVAKEFKASISPDDNRKHSQVGI